MLQTRRILDTQLDFNQKFFIPVHNHFNTLKIEIINSLNDGWFRDHVKETTIASYEIRMPDIDKLKANELGLIKLPINESAMDYRKLGLKPSADVSTLVKRKQ